MDNTQIGLAGEFYVLAQLVQRGLAASLTLANTKGCRYSRVERTVESVVQN